MAVTDDARVSEPRDASVDPPDHETPDGEAFAPAASIEEIRDVKQLGILVVYFLRTDDDLPLLQLHLDRVTRHTAPIPYTIYAATNRMTDSARAVIAATPNLTLCEIAPTTLRGSREHGYYLDALARRALDAGVSHICTLDVDSFPVRDDWVQVTVDALPESSALAGVLRSENGDFALPHPSATMTHRSFFDRFRPSFSPDSDGSPEFRRFLRRTGQRADTGIRLGQILWAQDLEWAQLLRTNALDLHYLMGGIYADTFFHLGGIGRGKIFRRDLQGSAAHRLTRPIERIPLRGPRTSQMKEALLRTVRGSVEHDLARRNGEIYAQLRAALLEDSDALIARLRGIDE